MLYTLDPTTIDPELEESLQTTWNARVVDYDARKFPFAEWILGRVQRMGYAVKDLKELHLAVPVSEVFKVTKKLCEDTFLPEFKRMVNRFVREEVVPKGKLELPVAVQRYLNVRIMLPNRPQGVFPFHTGLLYGHGPASRSLWMALTDVSADEDYTASMQIIDTQRSRRLMRQAVESKLGVNQMTELFGKESWPLKAGPGRVVFFNQENIHGNFVNVTGKTRVSIDFRVAEARYGDLLARKIAGGYFEMIPDTNEEEDRNVQTPPASFQNGRSNILYLNNNTPSTFGVPVHLQRYMVLDYCGRNKINYEFELFELEAMTHLPTLMHIVENLKCNVVLYSVFALPEDRAFRKRILDVALKNKVILHFVNEDVQIADETGRRKVEGLLSFAKYGQLAEQVVPV